jgi:hypothetical protein
VTLAHQILSRLWAAVVRDSVMPIVLNFMARVVTVRANISVPAASRSA